MADDLNKPLGLTPERTIPWRRIAIGGGGAAAFVAVAAIAWTALTPEPGPVATAPIATPAAGSTIAPERTGTVVTGAPKPGLSEVTATGDLSDVGEVVIHDPSNPAPVELASLPNPGLIEESSKGPLPRIADDGTRPIDAYARPAGAADDSLRVVIVIGGLGIDADGTRQAIEELPGSVTLAFAPYGNALKQDTAEALKAGHEIMLQVPLEPFNYPKTNPGPNTLTAEATPEENLSRLHWFLGRMTNYVGVVNYMGARFTAETAAMTPVIKDIGERGLLYLDDGSSQRSEAANVASGVAPFLRADVVLDADLSADAIDERLSQLTKIARERGYAVATATAFPMTIDRVAAFAKTAASRGIAIVPATALVPERL